MGQYYKIVNVDKKEFIKPWAFGCGAKLLEWGYLVNRGFSNDFVSAFHLLLSDRWKGDRVYVVGDYADPSDSTDVSEFDVVKNAIHKLFGNSNENGTDNLSAVIYGKKVSSVGEADSLVESLKKKHPVSDWKKVLSDLYSEFDWLGKPATVGDDCYSEGYPILLYACKGFTNVLDVVDKNELLGYITPRFICNSETHEYIDTMSLPVEWLYWDSDREDYDEADVTDDPTVSINPLAVLLAMGNGEGGGDYYGINSHLAGSWCQYTRGIFFSDSIPEGYSCLAPEFTEHELDENVA